jgi:hypothetical protein
VRTQGGPLRPLWAIVYAGIARAAAAYLCHGHAAAAYVARGLATDEPVYGISDIDLVLVVRGGGRRRGAERERLRRRWRWLCRAVPVFERLLPDVAFYEDAELGEATRGSVLTCDLPAFRGTPAPADEFGLRSRPGLHGPTRDWRLIRGRDRRPAVDLPERQERRIAAWLELQSWWSLAFRAATEPEAPSSSFLCVKLVAEPARILLSLDDGGGVMLRRREVLRRALVRLPEEEEAIRRALEQLDALGRAPEPRLADALPAFVRLTSAVAHRLRAELDGVAETPVRLAGVDGQLVLPPRVAGEEGLLPLVDWRALAIPSLPDECFRVAPLDPVDAGQLARAAEAGRSGPYSAIRADGLLLMPALGPWDRAFLRAVECPPTDPVSFALAGGADVAHFPEVPGWSAIDWGRRAVAEHMAWLGERPDHRRPEWPEIEAVAPSLRDVAWLLTAARAGLFLESVQAGDAELALTVAAVVDRLSELGAGARRAAETALEAYGVGVAGGPEPSPAAVAALRGLVTGLPAYARAS